MTSIPPAPPTRVGPREPMQGPVGSVSVVGRDEYFAKAKAARARTNPDTPVILAMYNSLIDGIVTDPELMVVPLDDHAFVRGHAIFDTASLANGRVYRLGIHIDRLFTSARLSRLKLPFGETEDENRAKITEIVCQTCLASGAKNASIRFFLSAGPGNFGFTPSGCEPAFYCVVFGGLAGFNELRAIDEVSIPLSKVPMKPPVLATAKSNNYMLNCMTAMAAQDEGGFFGVLVKDDDTIAEGAVVNFVCITPDKELWTPPFGDILAGTTCRKVLELARKHLVANGTLKAVRQEPLPVKVARQATEVFMVGGDTHVFPIKSWDKQPVGNGEIGPVAREVVRLLEEDQNNGNEEHIELDYSKVPPGTPPSRGAIPAKL